MNELVCSDRRWSGFVSDLLPDVPESLKPKRVDDMSPEGVAAKKKQRIADLKCQIERDQASIKEAQAEIKRWESI